MLPLMLLLITNSLSFFFLKKKATNKSKQMKKKTPPENYENRAEIYKPTKSTYQHIWYQAHDNETYS